MLDELVDNITPYNRRPIVLHGYAGPFLAIYGLWFYVWGTFYGFREYLEAGCIVVSVIGLLQIVSVLFCHWFVPVKCFFTCSRAKHPLEAEFVKVVPTPNNGSSELVALRRSHSEKDGGRLWFEFQKVHYIFDREEKKEFRAVEFLVEQPLSQYQTSRGLEDDAAVSAALDRYGDNRMEMVVPQFAELLMERATAPFFVFQVFCVGLWCLDEYWYYSVFTLLMLIMFEATLVRQQLKNMSEIRNMANKPYLVQTYRNRRWRQVFSNELTPGDIVSVGRSPNDLPVPCDLLLLRGPCIVDESMLTGESVPQMKEPVEELESDRVLCLETDSRLHILSGGTRIVQHTPPPKTSAGLKAPDNGCICFVLRTGFQTNQGRLLRTILFGAKRVTANNLETFFFILFLLIFAVAASAYVWVKGTENPDRSRYKLFLECTLILTSVVPPELPIELSLAVNSSLLALQKLGVFCTEPFRIPFAGKVDICCFDKTGTLTTDELVVEGVAGLEDSGKVVSLADVPLESVQVLATCHALAQMDDELVGDPLEKACLHSLDWTLTRNDTVIPRKGKQLPLKILRRFHFSSALKRMSVIAGYMPVGRSDVYHVGAVKGAPETLRPMFSVLPEDYDRVYQELTREGYRVLALGHRELGQLTHQQIRELSREDLETGLSFVGFVAISCPLKPDSKVLIKEILNSSHKVVMITGDNPLTACHVAKELRFTKRPQTLILEPDANGSVWRWVSVDRTVALPAVPRAGDDTDLVFKHYDLCLTGQGLAYLNSCDKEFFRKILPRIQIFARTSPKQKEKIVTELKSLGHVTLMCGDGTNDVGALKHADVGVALLSHPLEATKALREEASALSASLKDSANLKTNGVPPRKKGPGHRRPQAEEPSRPSTRQTAAQRRLEELMKELEAEERAQVVRLGDASIAAPFTSKYSSIQSICHVIKQGRCTLVTTLQMFKILALNALILAYSQSVLYLDGIKFSDSQATVQGVLLALCFLFVSRSKPLKVLAKQRPLCNIFNLYTLLTVTLQFAIHFGCLMFLVQEAHQRTPLPSPANETEVKEDVTARHFTPNLLNSTVYVMSVALQISTFAINYRGHPFMESLLENRHLLMSLLASGGAVAALAAGLLPDVANKFELVPFPPEFRNIVLSILVVDLVGCYILDRVVLFLFGDVR